MDALRKSLADKASVASSEAPKKAPNKTVAKKGISLVKDSSDGKSVSKSAKRKSA